MDEIETVASIGDYSVKLSGTGGEVIVNVPKTYIDGFVQQLNKM